MDEFYDYIITKPELNNETLEHFGVKGMRWGHRKAQKKSDKIAKKQKKYASKGDKYIKPKNQEQADALIKRQAFKTAKSAALGAGVGTLVRTGAHIATTKSTLKKYKKSASSIEDFWKEERSTNIYNRRVAAYAPVAAAKDAGSSAIFFGVASALANNHRYNKYGYVKNPDYKRGKK